MGNTAYLLVILGFALLASALPEESVSDEDNIIWQHMYQHAHRFDEPLVRRKRDLKHSDPSLESVDVNQNLDRRRRDVPKRRTKRENLDSDGNLSIQRNKRQSQYIPLPNQGSNLYGSPMGGSSFMRSPNQLYSPQHYPYENALSGLPPNQLPGYIQQEDPCIILLKNMMRHWLNSMLIHQTNGQYDKFKELKSYYNEANEIILRMDTKKCSAFIDSIRQTSIFHDQDEPEIHSSPTDLTDSPNLQTTTPSTPVIRSDFNDHIQNDLVNTNNSELLEKSTKLEDKLFKNTSKSASRMKRKKGQVLKKVKEVDSIKRKDRKRRRKLKHMMDTDDMVEINKLKRFGEYYNQYEDDYYGDYPGPGDYYPMYSDYMPFNRPPPPMMGGPRRFRHRRPFGPYGRPPGGKRLRGEMEKEQEAEKEQETTTPPPPSTAPINIDDLQEDIPIQFLDEEHDLEDVESAPTGLSNNFTTNKVNGKNDNENVGKLDNIILSPEQNNEKLLVASDLNNIMFTTANDHQILDNTVTSNTSTILHDESAGSNESQLTTLSDVSTTMPPPPPDTNEIINNIFKDIQQDLRNNAMGNVKKNDSKLPSDNDLEDSILKDILSGMDEDEQENVLELLGKPQSLKVAVDRVDSSEILSDESDPHQEETSITGNLFEAEETHLKNGNELFETNNQLDGERKNLQSLFNETQVIKDNNQIESEFGNAANNETQKVIELMNVSGHELMKPEFLLSKSQGTIMEHNQEQNEIKKPEINLGNELGYDGENETRNAFVDINPSAYEIQQSENTTQEMVREINEDKNEVKQMEVTNLSAHELIQLETLQNNLEIMTEGYQDKSETDKTENKFDKMESSNETQSVIEVVNTAEHEMKPSEFVLSKPEATMLMEGNNETQNVIEVVNTAGHEMKPSEFVLSKPEATMQMEGNNETRSVIEVVNTAEHEMKPSEFVLNKPEATMQGKNEIEKPEMNFENGLGEMRGENETQEVIEVVNVSEHEIKPSEVLVSNPTGSIQEINEIETAQMNFENETQKVIELVNVSEHELIQPKVLPNQGENIIEGYQGNTEIKESSSSEEHQIIPEDLVNNPQNIIEQSSQEKNKIENAANVINTLGNLGVNELINVSGHEVKQSEIIESKTVNNVEVTNQEQHQITETINNLENGLEEVGVNNTAQGVFQVIDVPEHEIKQSETYINQPVNPFEGIIQEKNEIEKAEINVENELKKISNENKTEEVIEVVTELIQPEIIQTKSGNIIERYQGKIMGEVGNLGEYEIKESENTDIKKEEINLKNPSNLGEVKFIRNETQELTEIENNQLKQELIQSKQEIIQPQQEINQPLQMELKSIEILTQTEHELRKPETITNNIEYLNQPKQEIIPPMKSNTYEIITQQQHLLKKPESNFNENEKIHPTKQNTIQVQVKQSKTNPIEMTTQSQHWFRKPEYNQKMRNIMEIVNQSNHKIMRYESLTNEIEKMIENNPNLNRLDDYEPAKKVSESDFKMIQYDLENRHLKKQNDNSKSNKIGSDFNLNALETTKDSQVVKHRPRVVNYLPIYSYGTPDKRSVLHVKYINEPNHQQNIPDMKTPLYKYPAKSDRRLNLWNMVLFNPYDANFILIEDSFPNTIINYPFYLPNIAPKPLNYY
nr:uncharacterized protein LOC111417402 [Onthophagus taurus]